jgi:glycosyltransferase involved in cell wall biosynthesis
VSTSPLVSVLVTSYNHGLYVEQALDSVLAQDFDDYELVITDDASPDDSAAVIRAWLERTGAEADVDLHSVNVGYNTTIARAVARSHGRFVLSLGADDWLDPDCVRRMSAFLLEQDDDVAAIYCDARQVDADGAVVDPSFLACHLDGRQPPEGHIFADLNHRNFLPALGVLARRSAMDAVGGYDQTLAFEDWDMWLRLADRYRFAYLDAVLSNRRLLATSTEHSMFGTAVMHRSIVTLQAKWLDRDEDTRIRSADRIRKSALVIAREDRVGARAILHSVADIPPPAPFPWAAVEAALAVPGAGRLMPAARWLNLRIGGLVKAERQAWASGRRLRRAT